MAASPLVQLLLSEWPVLAFVALILSIVSATAYKKRSPKADPVDASVQIQPPGRVAGTWEQQEFDYPAIEPAPYDILNKDCPKYRPFRWGPQYFVTMGIRTMQWANWIDLDHRYLEYVRIREERVAEKSTSLVKTLPIAQAAALECVRELSAYLTKRYPTVFACYPENSQFSRGGVEIDEIECKLRGKRWRIQNHENPKEVDDPMAIIAVLIPDDAYIMMEHEDGHYYLSAGASCTPGFFRFKDKVGLRLRDLHISSDVPYFESKLMKPMERFFSRLAVDKPHERNNYFFQLDDVLPWNKKMMGDEELFNHKTHSPNPELIKSGQVSWEPPKPIKDPEELRLRSERQTLRRMPLSGGILFTVKTYIYPLKTFADEPGVPGRFASAIRSWDDTVAAYKSRQLFGPVVLPYLDKKHAEQVAAGITVDGDRTTNYPL